MQLMPWVPSPTTDAAYGEPEPVTDSGLAPSVQVGALATAAAPGVTVITRATGDVRLQPFDPSAVCLTAIEGPSVATTGDQERPGPLFPALSVAVHGHRRRADRERRARCGSAAARRQSAGRVARSVAP